MTRYHENLSYCHPAYHGRLDYGKLCVYSRLEYADKTPAVQRRELSKCLQRVVSLNILLCREVGVGLGVMAANVIGQLVTKLQWYWYWIYGYLIDKAKCSSEWRRL